MVNPATHSNSSSRHRGFALAFESRSRSSGTKTFWTLLIAFAITLPIPFIAYFGFTKLMAPRITRDNAGIAFEQFQAVLNNGSVIIHDPATAATVAERAYREKMTGPLVDGWANEMRISALMQKDSCELTILSAGPDGAFGTGDDISMQQSFDLSKPGQKSP